MARAVRLVGVGLIIGAALCVFGVASAGVYKSRDAQGNWHFSDTPPPSSGASKGSQGKVEEVVLSSNFADAKVAIKPPIANPKRNGGASVALDNFGLKLDIAGSSNATIGRAFSGKDCSQSTDVQWSDGAVDLKGKVAEAAVAERFRNFGYLFVDGSEGAGSRADLHLDAELVAMKLDLCNSITMGNTFGSGSCGYVKVRSVLRAQPGGEPLYRGVSPRFYQADAAVNRGNSGGPLFNEAGELVALNVSGLVNAEGSSVNVNCLIPIGRALTAVGAAADGCGQA